METSPLAQLALADQDAPSIAPSAHATTVSLLSMYLSKCIEIYLNIQYTGAEGYTLYNNEVGCGQRGAQELDRIK